jgi:hypothetical protein
MQRWGREPWANRAAALWLAELLDRDALQRIEDALRLDVVEFPDEIRAAAALLYHLDRAGCWPHGAADARLAHALALLERMQRENVHAAAPDVGRAVEDEILALRERLAQPAGR